jgi:hypothetical protein
VSDKYNDWLQHRLASSVWSRCNSYYRAKSTDGSVGKVSAIFPGPFVQFWWVCRLRWADYVAVGAEKLERRLQMQRIRNWGAVLLLAMAWVTTAWLGMDRMIEIVQMWGGH